MKPGGSLLLLLLQTAAGWMGSQVSRCRGQLGVPHPTSLGLTQAQGHRVSGLTGLRAERCREPQAASFLDAVWGPREGGGVGGVSGLAPEAGRTADRVLKSTEPSENRSPVAMATSNLPQQRQFEFVQNVSNKDLRQQTHSALRSSRG